MALPAILAPVAGLLLQKGLGCVTDILGSLGDAGIAKAKEFIQEKTGIDITSQREIEALNIEQVAHLKETILNNFVELQKIHNLNREQDLQNTKDARLMNIELAKLGLGKQLTFTNLISAWMLFFTTIYIGCVTFMDIPEANTRNVDTVLGFSLGTIIATVLNFYLGSSMKDSNRSTQEQFDTVMNRIDIDPYGRNKYYPKPLPESSVTFGVDHTVTHHESFNRGNLPLPIVPTLEPGSVKETSNDNDFKSTHEFQFPEIDEYTEEDKLNGILK